MVIFCVIFLFFLIVGLVYLNRNENIQMNPKSMGEIDCNNNCDKLDNEYVVPYEQYNEYLHSITPKAIMSKLNAIRPLTSTEKFFLRAVSNKSVKNLDIARHWYYIYNLNICETIALLIGSEHLQICDDIALERYTIPKLKEILVKKELSKTGNKQVLIDRIHDNFTEHELRDICGDELMYYKITEKGKQVVGSLVDSATYNLELEDECIKLILKKQYDEAYRLVGTFRLNSRIQTGLNFDWAKARTWNGRKLIKSNKRIKYYSACCIFCEMMGISTKKALTMYNRIFGKKFDIAKEMAGVSVKHYHFYNNSLRNLNDLKDCDIKKYRISCVLDAKTCKKCAHMDGKIFNVNDAVIGINAPPFEFDCRCMIVAHFEDRDLSNSKRSARNPITKQRFFVPGNTTYREWSKKFLPEKYNEYFCECEKNDMIEENKK